MAKAKETAIDISSERVKRVEFFADGNVKTLEDQDGIALELLPTPAAQGYRVQSSKAKRSAKAMPFPPSMFALAPPSKVYPARSYPAIPETQGTYVRGGSK